MVKGKEIFKTFSSSFLYYIIASYEGINREEIIRIISRLSDCVLYNDDKRFIENFEELQEKVKNSDFDDIRFSQVIAFDENFEKISKKDLIKGIKHKSQEKVGRNFNIIPFDEVEEITFGEKTNQFIDEHDDVTKDLLIKKLNKKRCIHMHEHAISRKPASNEKPYEKVAIVARKINKK